MIKFSFKTIYFFKFMTFLWIVLCLYIWIELSETPISETGRKAIWPIVYRDYIWAEK